MHRLGIALALLLLSVASVRADDALRTQARQIFGPLPAEAPNAANPITQEKIELGRMLYYEPRLSRNHDVSCNSCHQLDKFGVDAEKTSPGHAGQRGGRNSPTVYNAALHIRQFWDGRAADVEEQAKGPVLNPIEMAMPDEATVVAVLRSIPGYQPLFAAAFPGEEPAITYDNMARAIGVFERRLMTPGRFEKWLAGDDAALSGAEQEGLRTFISTGCPTCHAGPGFGGSMFQKLGLVEPYPTQDQGRQQATGKPEDQYFFKVPSLRNAAKTGPWFHDGSIQDLDMAIRVMARFQLGRTLTDAQAGSIAGFLEALTGDVDEAYVARPELPASGPQTPAPDASVDPT
jgi:cytochrome c peroxidase